MQTIWLELIFVYSFKKKKVQNFLPIRFIFMCDQYDGTCSWFVGIKSAFFGLSLKQTGRERRKVKLVMEPMTLSLKSRSFVRKHTSHIAVFFSSLTQNFVCEIDANKNNWRRERSDKQTAKLQSYGERCVCLSSDKNKPTVVVQSSCTWLFFCFLPPSPLLSNAITNFFSDTDMDFSW